MKTRIECLNWHRNLLIFLILSFPGFIFGQSPPRWQTGRDGAYTYRNVPGDPAHARFYRLPNGLTVILSVNKTIPRIKAFVVVRAGSSNDPDDHTGLAHYLEHMLFKGTDRYGTSDWAKEKPLLDQVEVLYTQYNHTVDTGQRKVIYHRIDSVSGIAAHYAIPNEYDKMMDAIGSTGKNAFTAEEVTGYSEDIPAGSLNAYLAIQAERFHYPVFRLFPTELEVVYEEKNLGLDDIDQKEQAALMEGLFPDMNYGTHTTIGTIADLKNPSLTAIRQFYNAWYVPNNMAIILSGDLDPSATIREVAKDFAYMQPKPLHEYKPVPQKPLTMPVTKNVYGPGQEYVKIAYRLPGIDDQRAQLLLSLLTGILSNGYTGLIDSDLDKMQKLRSADASSKTLKLYSLLELSGFPKPGQSIAQVKDLLTAELGKVAEGNFDPALLKAVANNVQLRKLQESENYFPNFPSYYANAVALLLEFINDKGDYWPQTVDFTDAMARVTKPELMAFARKYLCRGYVAVYKRTGADSSILKVDKPPITPVYMNKTGQSAFLRQIMTMPEKPVRPEYIDYNKVIHKGKIGQAALLYVQNKNDGLFKLSYRFKIGSGNDRLLPLATQYLESLGTGKMTAGELEQEFYAIACTYQFNEQREETTLTIEGLQANFDQAVRLEETLIKDCRPDTAALSRLKKERSDTNRTADIDGGKLTRGLIDYATYGPLATRKFKGDHLSLQELEVVTASRLTAILHSLFSFPQTIDYYGPISMHQLIGKINRLHPVPPAFKQAPPATAAVVPVNSGTSLVLVANYNAVDANVSWLRFTDKYEANDPAGVAAILVFNKYFGKGPGSVIWQSIRESSSLAYSADAEYVIPNRKGDCYRVTADISTQADKLKDAISAMNRLFRDLPEDEQALTGCKQSILHDKATKRVMPKDYIANYLEAQKQGLPADYERSVYEAVAKVTFADLKQLHDKIMKDKPFTYCIVSPESKIDTAWLGTLGQVKVLTADDLFEK